MSPPLDPTPRSPVRVRTAFVGCKVSQADSEAARAELVAAGLEAVRGREAADVAIVHTCAVTAEAERKSRQLVNRLVREGLRVVVAGCAATRDAGQFTAAGVTSPASRSWAEIAADLRGAVGEGRSGDALRQPHPAPVRRSSRGRTRFVLKAQDGCAGRCTYCLVRLVRGTPRSLPLPDAVSHAAAAVEAGCGEVVLSGIDLSAYRDPVSGAGLADLVGALAAVPGLARLRLSSLEPRALDERLIGALQHPLVARHLHVPLQSADDGVLRAMGRPYGWRAYREALERVRERLADCAFSTDLMVGFPAEDEAAFGRSLAALEEGLFDRVHVFAYSPRPGTEAAKLAPLPVGEVRRRRAAALAAAANAARAAAGRALGREADVLVEEQREGLWKGYSSQYVKYYLSGAGGRGRIVRAVADEVYGDGVKGRTA